MKARGKLMKIKKTEANLNLRNSLRSIVSALVMVSLLGVFLPAFAQQRYERGVA